MFGLGRGMLAPYTPPHQRGQFREGTKDGTRLSLKEGGRGRPALSLKLSDTGFSSLADKRRLSTGQLVQHDQAAIVVDLRTATFPAIRNSV